MLVLGTVLVIISLILLGILVRVFPWLWDIIYPSSAYREAVRKYQRETPMVEILKDPDPIEKPDPIIEYLKGEK